MQAKVSIITPSFNRANLVDETAQSIFSQNLQEWEWVIVDDGSTDKSWEILESYAASDKRVKIFKRNRDPKGACTCRNIAVENCSGKYLIFLDTDDLITPFCLEQRLRAMEENPELDFGIFPSLMFREKPFDLNLWWNIDKKENELTRQFHQDAVCQGTGILIRKDSFDRVGRWDESLMLWQDIDLFFRLYIQGYKYKKFFNLPPDLHNRINDTSLSRGDFFRYDKLLSRIIVVKRTVELLEKNDKADLIPEIRYMTAEIYSGLVRSMKMNDADKFLQWAELKKVFSKSEISLLKKLKVIFRLRLNNFSIGKRILSRYQHVLRIENTLSKIPYSEEPILIS